MIVLVPEYIVGIGILKGLALNLSHGLYQFATKPYISARPVLVRQVKVPPVQIPATTKLVTMKQYQIPGGHEDISLAIKDLVDVLKPTRMAWNNPVWPAKKSDTSGRTTVDFRESNKHSHLLRQLCQILLL